ncbi:MAG: AAA family ATPase [Bryobacteraceae bacterium]
MRISRLTLKNWRNFRSAEVELGERVFLVGPNASGKSNFLDAIRFLRDVAKAGGGLQRGLSERGGLSKVRCLAARRDPDVEIEVTLSEGDSEENWRYAIGITQEVRGLRQPYIRYERVWRDGVQILNRPNSADEKDHLRKTQTHLEQINANEDFREIARFFESIRYLHLVPQLLRHPEAYQGTGPAEDPYGRNFLEMIAKTPEATRKTRLKKIEAALQHAVPQLRALTDTKDEAGVPHLEAIYEHWRPNAGRQREDQFSDGTIRLIGLFWSLLDGDAPLLLEEPELSLHSSIVAKLPGLFHKLGRRKKRQLIVSTHSWDLLSEKGIGGEEVVMLKPDRDGTKALLASSNPEVRDLLNADLSIADAVLPRTAPEQISLFDLAV